MLSKNDVVAFLNTALTEHNQGEFTTGSEDSTSISYELKDLRIKPGYETARAIAPLARLEHPGNLRVDEPQMPMFYEAQRMLVQEGLLSAGERDDLKGSVDLQGTEGDTGFAKASFSVDLRTLNTRPIVEAQTADKSIESLSRAEMLALVQKERLAAYWNVQDFLQAHGNTVAAINGQALVHRARRNEVIIFKESELTRYLPGGDMGDPRTDSPIESPSPKSSIMKKVAELSDWLARATGRAFGTTAKSDELDTIHATGRLPDNIKGFLGHTLHEHRAIANGISYLVFQNEPRNPYFPVGKTGTVERRDEVNNGLSVFHEHMNSLGASIAFSHDWRTKPTESDHTGLRVLPDAALGEALYRSFIDPDNLAQLNKHAVSNFHIDLGRGITLTRFIVAGIDPELLASRVSTDQLRTVLQEQIAEEQWLASKVSAPAGSFEALSQTSQAYRSIAKDRGSETRIGIGNASLEGIDMALRSQFQGLLSNLLSEQPIITARIPVPGSKPAPVSHTNQLEIAGTLS